MAGRRPHQSGKSGGGNRNIPVNRLSGGYDNRKVSPWLSGGGSSEPRLSGGSGYSGPIDPQAQLALASNLLNNLLSPHHPHPPSLMSLGGLGTPPYRPMYGNSGAPAYGFGGLRTAGRDGGGQMRRDNYKGGKHYGNNDQNRNKPAQYRNKSGDQNKKGSQQKDRAGDKKASDAAKANKDQPKDKETDLANKADGTEVKDGDNKAEGSGEQQSQMDGVEEGGAEIEKGSEQTTSYAGISPSVLYCHICKKHMWDDISFEKHLDGRPHKMMVNELDQSYKMTVQLLRHETRVWEQQRESDIQRAQRKGKVNLKSQQRGFCTMCDLNFLGTLPGHRRNEHHQRLKKFLHPRCNLCDEEFITRLEWDDHKLLPGHLAKLDEYRKKTRPHLGVSEFDIVDFIEDVNDGVLYCAPDVKVDGKRTTFTEEEKEVIESMKDKLPTEEDKEDAKYPKFIPGQTYGEDFVTSYNGYLCRACYRFMPNEEDLKAHCQGLGHYNNVIHILKIKERIAPAKGSADDDSKMDESAAEKPTNKDVDEDEPQAKRAKLDETGKDSEQQVEDRDEGNTEQEAEPVSQENGCNVQIKIELVKDELEAAVEPVKEEPREEINVSKVKNEEMENGEPSVADAAKEIKEEPAKEAEVETADEIQAKSVPKPIGRAGRGGPRNQRGRGTARRGKRY